MNTSWLRDISPAQISRVTGVAVAILSLTAIGLGGTAIYSSGQNKAGELRIASLNKELRDAQGSMKHVNEVLASGTQLKGPAGRPIVVEFQSAIVKAGRANNVRIETPQVGDPALFISRYKNAPDETLQQIEIQMSLSGHLADVVRTLDQFSTFRIPFEFGEMQIARDSSVEGAGRVVARISVYVLVPTEAPK